MNTILNVSEYQFEEGLFARLMASLPDLLHKAIHGEIERISKRHISNGIWEPLPGSLSATMWAIFSNLKLDAKKVDFKQLTIISLERGWEYKSVYREFERWRTYYL